MVESINSELDRLDRQLLGLLTSEGRLSHVELSERVGLSTTACARRIKLLEDAGIIRGYQARLDLPALGLSTTVIVQITLNSQSEDTLDHFERAIRDCPSVLRCHLMSGSADYMVTVAARDIEDFESIHRTQLSRLPGVARIQSSFALRHVIDRSLPSNALRPAAAPAPKAAAKAARSSRKA